jgi:gluconate kinase
MNCPICEHEATMMSDGIPMCENNDCPWLKHQHERWYYSKKSEEHKANG